MVWNWEGLSLSWLIRHGLHVYCTNNTLQYDMTWGMREVASNREGSPQIMRRLLGDLHIYHIYVLPFTA
jgi:hypothetical protein